MRLIHDGIDANSEFSTKHAATRLRCEQKHRAMCMCVWCVALTEKMFSWMYLCSYSSLLPQSYTYETTVHNKTTIKNNLLVGIVSIPKFIFHFRFVSFICFFFLSFLFRFYFPDVFVANSYLRWHVTQTFIHFDECGVLRHEKKSWTEFGRMARYGIGNKYTHWQMVVLCRYQ